MLYTKKLTDVDCHSVEELLAGGALSELSAEQRLALTEHTLVCSTCREELQKLKHAVRHLDIWEPPSAPESLASKTIAAIRREQKRF